MSEQYGQDGVHHGDGIQHLLRSAADSVDDKRVDKDVDGMSRSYVGAFKCNWCKRNFTDEQFPHLSLRIELGSGLATPHTRFPGWRVAKLIPQDAYHFCGGECLGKWADTFMIEESDAI